MSKFITTIIAVCCVSFSPGSYGDQKSLDLSRAAKVDAVLKSLRKEDAESLSAVLPELTKEDASKLIKQISKSWGDLAKLSAVEEKLPKDFDKGAMRIVGHWGSEETRAGQWLELKSDEAPKRWLRIGLLFQKGSSDAKQILAVEFRDIDQGDVDKAALDAPAKSEEKG